MIGGYLGASLLGIVGNPRATSRRRAAGRLAALGIYAVIAGLLTTALLVGVIGVLGGHFFALWGIGALTIFTLGAATAGLQAMLGVPCTLVAVLLFVVLGNPSAGGAYARVLLPGLWRTIGGILPPGATTDLLR